MINFTLSIDLSGGKDPNGYFDIEVLSLSPFTESQIDDMVTTRIAWGELKIKNLPYKYAKLGGDKYKLYDILLSQKPTQEIHLRFVSDYQTIYGYFGIVDCDIDDDQKVISVKVYTLDQYTDFLENRETEIKLFDEGNIIVNGDFDTWSEGTPIGWERLNNDSSILKLEQKYVLDKSAIGISDYGHVSNNAQYFGQWDATSGAPGTGDLHEGFFKICSVAGTYNGIHYSVGDGIIYDGYKWVPYLFYRNFPSNPIGIDQFKTNVLKNSLCNVSFFYAVTGTSEKYKNLYFDLFLTDSESSDVYRLLNTGEWTKEISNTSSYLYSEKRVCIPITDLDKYRNFNKATNRIPVNGILKFVLYRPENNGESNGWDTECKLLVNSIIISVSAIELKSVTLEFSSKNMVTKPQSEIYWLGKEGNEPYFYKWDKDQSRSLTDMFEVNGTPRLGAIPCTSQKSETYSDLVRAFEDSDHESYKFELSRITVFKGKTTRSLLSINRYYYAVAEFSREEYYLIDYIYTQDDYENGICSENEVGEYMEPERNAGWHRTGRAKIGSNEILWVRTPFNGSVDSWNLGDLDQSSTSRSYEKLFDYYDKITSVKKYPTESSSKLVIDNAIDLREIISQLYQKTHKSLIGKQVYSNFFWNDPLSETETEMLYLGNDTNCNYVTMTNSITDIEAKNALNKLLAIHTYEFVPSESRTPSDEDKTILKTSAKKFTDDLLILFPQCYWFIDEDKNLHIEHLKYFDRVNTAKNLTSNKYDYLKEYGAWKYDKSKMYTREEYTTPNSGYIDFNKSVITFDKITGNKRGDDIKATYSANIISTDVQYCAENPNNLNNGIVLVVYATENGKNVVSYGVGQNSGKSVINGELSIATLLRNYATYEGTWEEGLINDKGNNPNGKQTFYNTIRAREGKEFMLKGIVLDKLVMTRLGIGFVKSREIDYNTGTTKITAVYRHDDLFLGIGDNDLVDMGTGNITSPELPVIGYRQVPIDNITQTGATFNGNIIDDGGAPVTSRGFCYSTSPNPTIDDSVISGGSGTGFYSVLVSGLTINTNYFIREFATNSKGTSYGVLYAFKTAQNEPSVFTMFIGFDLLMRAEIMGSVISDGGLAMARGIFWATHPNVTKNDQFIHKDFAGVGDYQVLLSVENGNTYYARAGITPDLGLTWYLGNEISFDAQW